MCEQRIRKIIVTLQRKIKADFEIDDAIQILTLVRRVSDVILLKKELITQRYILLQSETDLFLSSN